MLRKEMLDNMDTDGDGFIVKEEMAANREQIPTAANKLLSLIVNIPRGGSVNYVETAHLYYKQVCPAPRHISRLEEIRCDWLAERSVWGSWRVRRKCPIAWQPCVATLSSTRRPQLV